MTASVRLREASAAHARGWALTQLVGKRPISPGWQKAPAPTLEQVQAWALAGNVGLRTGAISGVVVIDVDTAKGGTVDHLNLPRTVTVITGSGGHHLYFRHAGQRIGNSVGRLAAHVDVRGDGGQVVFAGSVHPDTAKFYVWAEGLSPDGAGVAELPEPILRQLVPPGRRHSAYCADIAVHISGSRSAPRKPTRYGSTALARECAALASMPPDSGRNNVLNRAAYCLGQLVAGGHLTESDVIAALQHAAAQCGLPAYEAQRTIHSGLAAGQREPRA